MAVYRQFYNTHKVVIVLRGEKNLNLLVRFALEDVGNYLLDLFLRNVCRGVLCHLLLARHILKRRSLVSAANLGWARKPTRLPTRDCSSPGRLGPLNNPSDLKPVTVEDVD